MIRNYLKTAFRNLVKHKAYSAINIIGLAVGVTCCFLIVLYVITELGYERMHINRDRIYRVATEFNYGGQTLHIAPTITPLGTVIAEDIPEVVSAVRITPVANALIGVGENRFREKYFCFVDSTFFDIFTFPLLAGDPKTALRDPFTIVISPEIAHKYFGDDDPIGKVLSFENQFDFTVTGVLNEIPDQTQLKSDFYASYASRYTIGGTNLDSWLQAGEVFCYILLAEGAAPAIVEQKLPDLILKHGGDFAASIYTLHLQPLNDIYLHSKLMGEFEPSGNIIYIYLFSAIAVLILLIACINFMNLTTARSMHRAREVGMRKTLGAKRSQLIRQFLGESITISFIAVLLAIALFELCYPLFSRFLEKDLLIDHAHHAWIIPALVGTTILVGLIAGSYPALYLSRYRPSQILKSAAKPGSTRSILRKSLVVLQFTISIALIIATVVIFSQLQYVKKKDLGYNQEHVILLGIDNPALQQQYEPLKKELIQHPNIVNVSGAYSTPGGESLTKRGVKAEGVAEEDVPVMILVTTDEDYIETLGLEITAGRGFSPEFATDATEAYIINQAAVAAIGWTDQEAIGKQFSILSSTPEHQRPGKIIGVVNDYHVLSLHEKIEPLFMYINPPTYSVLAIRISPQDLSGTLAFIEKTCKNFAPNIPFEYSFLDESFDKFYKSELKLSQIFTSFSLLAILIACLGLFGLTAYAAEQRTKEIGIRKALGATITSIVSLISKEFILLVIISNIIAWPIAYYAMNKWLQNFAYHIEMEVTIFILAAVSALVIAIGTISFHTIKAASANPVNSLRYE
ncbi:hypothetical protein AMJ86_09055 [bacterium SM23_57]|nr:MAG: hypothetical protein AMJ86_09055 [bacterium SM23_57]